MTDTIYKNVINQIIKAQELIVGPIAWEIASTISGITVDLEQKTLNQINIRKYNEIICSLLESYYKLLGPVANIQLYNIISIVLIIEGHDNNIFRIIRSPQIITKQSDINSAQTELDRVDMVIIEATQSFEHIYNLLGKAAIMQKPVLCIYKKDEPPHELLSLLDKSSKSQYVFAQAYTEKTLPDIVQRFVSKINGKIVETPNIKFTLRLTPSLDRYLERVAQEKNVSKADFVRSMISEKQNKDNDNLEF